MVSDSCLRRGLEGLGLFLGLSRLKWGGCK
jgi:hypothetical protein